MCEAPARVVRMLRTPRVEAPQRCKIIVVGNVISY